MTWRIIKASIAFYFLTCMNGQENCVKPIDFSSIDTDWFMIAAIHTAQEVMDDLVELFDELLEATQEMNMDLTF